MGYDGFAMSRPRHEFEADTVRVSEEGGVVVVVVFRVLGWLRGLDPQLTQETVGFVHGCSIPKLKADVMQPDRVRIVISSSVPGRADRVLERAIEVVGVAVSADRLVALAKTERAHDAIIERFGPREVGNAHVDVVEADHLHWSLLPKLPTPRLLLHRIPGRVGRTHTSASRSVTGRF